MASAPAAASGPRPHCRARLMRRAIAEHAHRRLREGQGQRGQGQRRRGRVRGVAQDEAEEPGQRGVRRGEAGDRAAGVAGGEERRQPLRRGQREPAGHGQDARQRPRRARRRAAGARRGAGRARSAAAARVASGEPASTTRASVTASPAARPGVPRLHVGLGGEQQQRQQRRRRHRRGVAEMADQVRSQRVAQAGHERAHALPAQPAHVQEDQRAARGQRGEHQHLEGGERRQRRPARPWAGRTRPGDRRRAAACPGRCPGFHEGMSPLRYESQTAARSGRWRSAPSPGPSSRPARSAGAWARTGIAASSSRSEQVLPDAPERHPSDFTSGPARTRSARRSARRGTPPPRAG